MPAEKDRYVPCLSKIALIYYGSHEQVDDENRYCYSRRKPIATTPSSTRLGGGKRDPSLEVEDPGRLIGTWRRGDGEGQVLVRRDGQLQPRFLGEKIDRKSTCPAHRQVGSQVPDPIFSPARGPEASNTPLQVSCSATAVSPPSRSDLAGRLAGWVDIERHASLAVTTLVPYHDHLITTSQSPSLLGHACRGYPRVFSLTAGTMRTVPKAGGGPTTAYGRANPEGRTVLDHNTHLAAVASERPIETLLPHSHHLHPHRVPLPMRLSQLIARPT